MWNCQHPECHNVQDCAICWKEGVTWCPHQECRYQNAEQPPATPEKPHSTKTRGTAWTPTLAGNVLKLLFVAAAAAGTWWLLRSGGSGPPEDHDLLSPDSGARAADFSPWEPES
jgi:hypothetical protein